MIYSVYWAGRFSTATILSAPLTHQWKPYLTPELSEEEFNLLIANKAHQFHAQKSKTLSEAIKETEQDSFIFILAREQLEEFEKWLKEEKLEDFLMYKMPRPITNANHYHTENRQLTLAVLQSPNHFQRKDVV